MKDFPVGTKLITPYLVRIKAKYNGTWNLVKAPPFIVAAALEARQWDPATHTFDSSVPARTDLVINPLVQHDNTADFQLFSEAAMELARLEIHVKAKDKMAITVPDDAPTGTHPKFGEGEFWKIHSMATLNPFSGKKLPWSSQANASSCTLVAWLRALKVAEEYMTKNHPNAMFN